MRLFWTHFWCVISRRL